MLFFVQLPNKFKSTKLKSQEAFYRQILRNTTQRSYHFRLLMKESQIFWKSSITCFCVCADMLCLVFIEYVTVHYDQLHGHLHSLDLSVLQTSWGLFSCSFENLICAVMCERRAFFLGTLWEKRHTNLLLSVLTFNMLYETCRVWDVAVSLNITVWPLNTFF